MKQTKELETLQQRVNELEKEKVRAGIGKEDMQDQLDAREDLIAQLEERVEEQNLQIKMLMEQLNETGEKHQTELQSLKDLNKEFQEKAETIEQRVAEAHERYV